MSQTNDPGTPSQANEPQPTSGRTALRRTARPHLVLRRNIQPQEMLALVGGFILLMLMVAAMLTPIIHPVFPLAALIFFLYPFRKVIVPRRTMQLGIAAFMVWLFLNLSGALFPFIVAFIIAYLFSPLVTVFQRRGVPRWITAVTIMLGMLGVYLLIGMFIVPGVAAQFQQLFVSAEGLFKNANAMFDRAHLVSELERLGIPRAQANELVVNELEPQVKQIAGWLFTQLGSFVKNASTILEGVVNLMLIPILSLYMMLDFERLRVFVRSKLLQDNARYVYYVRQVDEILSAYLRGIMITSSIVGTAAVIVLSIFGVPYAVVIGILTGVFNLIPTVGIFLNIGVAAIIFLFAPGDFLLNTGITTGMVFGLHALNGYLIEPRVIGHKVGLPPVMLIASLFVFAHFLGFVGLLIAVPTSAVIAMFLKEWYRSTVREHAPPANAS